MTIELEFEIPQGMNSMGDWQVRMAEQIESNRGFPLSEIERELRNGGTTLLVRVETNLPSTAVENMVSDVEEHLPSNATHVETREIP